MLRANKLKQNPDKREAMLVIQQQGKDRLRDVGKIELKYWDQLHVHVFKRLKLYFKMFQIQ